VEERRRKHEQRERRYLRRQRGLCDPAGLPGGRGRGRITIYMKGEGGAGLLSHGQMDTINIFGNINFTTPFEKLLRKCQGSVRQRNPHVPWKDMAEMRDRLIHGYFGIDNEILWKTVKEFAPEVGLEIKTILNRELSNRKKLV